MDENQISEEEAMNSKLIENNEQETEICLPEKSAQCQAMIYDEFECAESADELMNCTPLKELGWRFQKPLEVAFSYGVIKDIELEMTEKEIRKPQPVQVEQETTILKKAQRHLNPNTPLYNNMPEPMAVSSISQNEDGVMSYANVTRSVPRLRSEITSNTKSIPLTSQSGAMEVSQTLQEKTISTKRKRKKKQNQNEVFENDISTESEEVINNNDDDMESELKSRKEKKERREKLKSTFNFRQLLSKLYAIFTNSQEQLKNKMIQVMSFIIECETLLRKKFLAHVYEDKMKLIYDEEQNNKIWTSLDEITDFLEQNVVNFFSKTIE
ncbi:unnamed protein product [Parnassius apollo]|uniref:(apollo) hypothetical protein n=1 Tax=Parnassius apollo TaxID=110799 RepID=A0A8S3WV40_PARAO|nr:unnamed protein product [Parnassius apollo]